MSILYNTVTPRARLFEFLRQEHVAQSLSQSDAAAAHAHEAALAFQKAALRSLHRSG